MIRPIPGDFSGGDNQIAGVGTGSNATHPLGSKR